MAAEEIPFWWESMTTCGKCEETFSRERDCLFPRLLPCGHTLCESCLASLLSSPPAVCCLCKKDIIMDAGGEGGGGKGVGDGETVKSPKDFPPSFYIVELLSSTVPKPKSAHQELECFKCNGTPVAATCQICNVILCEKCWSDVHSFGPFRMHAKLPPSRLADRWCPQHPNYPKDLVCVDDSCAKRGTLICIMCERGTHKGHRTEPCESVAPSARKILRSNVATLQDHMAEVHSALSTLQLTLLRISPSNAEDPFVSPSLKSFSPVGPTQLELAREGIHDAFQRLHTLLDEREKELMAAVDVKAEEKTKLLCEQRRGFTAFLGDAGVTSSSAYDLLHNHDEYGFMERFTAQSTDVLRVHSEKVVYTPCVDDDLGLSLHPDRLIDAIKSFGTLTPIRTRDAPTHAALSRIPNQNLYEAPPLFERLVGSYDPSYNGNEAAFLFPDRSTQAFISAQPLPADPKYYFEVEVLKSEGCFGYFGVVTSAGGVKSGCEYHVVLSDSMRQAAQQFTGLKKSAIVINNASAYPSPYQDAVSVPGPIGSTGATHGFLLDRTVKRLTWYVNGSRIGQVPITDGHWYLCLGTWCCKTHHFLVRLQLPLPSK
jgi:hypothetical protein